MNIRWDSENMCPKCYENDPENLSFSEYKITKD